MSPKLKRVLMTFAATFVTAAVASITSSQFDLSTITDVNAVKSLAGAAVLAGLLAGVEAVMQSVFANVATVPTVTGDNSQV